MYTSTRSSIGPIGAKEAILQGLAADGGLFVMPDLSSCSIDLEEIIDKDFSEIARIVYLKLLDDFSESEIDECIEKAYSGTFENDEIAPIRQVGDHYILELWHGPTSAFKDVALTMLPQLLSKSLQSAGKKALILTATSGDTGKAAMSGFADVKGTAICVYYPHGGVSPIQEKQMSTQIGKNVDVFAIRGNFDDAQRGVKELFVNNELNSYANQNGIVLSSANSINIGRLIPQIIYYFSSYAYLVKSGAIKLGEAVTYTVPTGNFGDVLAGYYAHKLGLPARFSVAANKNNVLDDFIKTGIYDRNREFFKTMSPSMDILISSNLERLLYYLLDCDSNAVASLMADLKTYGKYEIDESTKSKLQSLFTSGTTNEDETSKTIKEVYDSFNYVLDTHSAVAYNVAQKLNRDKVSVVLSTASPYKFPQAVMKSLYKDFDDEWEALSALEDINPDACPKALSSLSALPTLHDSVIDQENMCDTVSRAIDKLASL